MSRLFLKYFPLTSMNVTLTVIPIVLFYGLYISLCKITEATYFIVSCLANLRLYLEYFH